MENNDLGSKKMNNKQSPLDESNAENHNPEATQLVPEVETNSSGEQKIVYRARNVDTNLDQNDEKSKDNTTCNVEIFSEEETQRMIENKDHNSDITAHRYPNSSPDNHKDRGNIKLDE